MKNFRLLFILFVLTFFTNANCTESYTIKSPNSKISISFWLNSKGEPVYSVSHSDSIILKESKLGIVRSDEDFSTNLTLDSVSAVSEVKDNYTLLHGKRLNCTYSGKIQIFFLRNSI